MNEEIKHLINQLDLEDDRKQALLENLEKNGVTQELADEVQKLLLENEAALRQEAPEVMAELEKVHQQAAQQIEQAYQEYNSAMNQIDQEAKDLESEASKDLDEAQLEESRAALH